MANGIYKPRPPGSLKRVTAAFIDACGGPEPVGEILGVSRSEVFRLGDTGFDHAGRYMNVRQVRILEAFLGATPMTEFLAAEQGCVVLRPGAVSAGGFGLAIANLSDVNAKTVMHLAKSLDNDAVIDRREAGEGIDLIDQDVAVQMALRARLVKIRDQET